MRRPGERACLDNGKEVGSPEVQPEAQRGESICPRSHSRQEARVPPCDQGVGATGGREGGGLRRQLPSLWAWFLRG